MNLASRGFTYLITDIICSKVSDRSLFLPKGCLCWSRAFAYFLNSYGSYVRYIYIDGKSSRGRIPYPALHVDVNYLGRPRNLHTLNSTIHRDNINPQPQEINMENPEKCPDKLLTTTHDIYELSAYNPHRARTVLLKQGPTNKTRGVLRHLWYHLHAGAAQQRSLKSGINSVLGRDQPGG